MRIEEIFINDKENFATLKARKTDVIKVTKEGGKETSEAKYLVKFICFDKNIIKNLPELVDKIVCLEGRGISEKVNGDYAEKYLTQPGEFVPLYEYVFVVNKLRVAPKPKAV